MEIILKTENKYEVKDITKEVAEFISVSKLKEGICTVFVKHTSCAITITENYDPNIGKDLVNALDKLIPEGVWLHDKIDNNGSAHIKSAILGPSEIIPVRGGELLLGKWQNIVLCEFDGPKKRKILVNLCKPAM